MAMGRLTLNPIAHLDLIGSLILPLFLFLMRSPFLFGWAKPVPVNFYNLKDLKKDTIMVSAAGILANLGVAIASGILLKIVLYLFQITSGLFIFEALARMLNFSIIINCVLAIFNMIPIPPLDGSKILMMLLPPKNQMYFARIEPFGFLIIMALLMLRVLDIIMLPPLIFLVKILGGELA